MNILNFGLAVNDRRRNSATGEWEDYANFIDCVLFGNRADFLSRTLRKGTKVVVEGKLRYSSWERDGQRRSKIEVIVDDVDFVSPRQQQGSYAPQQGGGNYGNGGQQQGYGQQSYAPQQSSGQFTAAAPQPSGYDQPAPQQQSAPSPAPQQRPPVSAPPQADVYDEDIPF